jgi:NADPH-dependent curcumin reductase CurA
MSQSMPSPTAPDADSAEPTRTRHVVLTARPDGEPTLANFEVVETKLPLLGPGQVLVRNTWMSVDPYMRGRMDDIESYIPPFALGSPLEGAAVGEVIATRADAVPVGATVSHFLGWREYAIVDAEGVTIIDIDVLPANAYLGALGTTGLTAWTALTKIAPVRQGDVVFVSAAAGGVGIVAAQFGRRLGASRVVGSAGGPEKAKRLVTDFGYDAAIDYKAGLVAAQLAAAAPDGIDVYLDSVGGDHLTAAIDTLRPGGRIALVGAISQYNATHPIPGPHNLYEAAKKELTLRGMLVSSYFADFPDYITRAAAWLADGSLRYHETIVEGLDQAPAAFLDMMHGANLGKMLVRL